MTVETLHVMTGMLVEQGRGNVEVAIQRDTFGDSELGTVALVETGELRGLRGVDDHGPTGPEYPFLVLEGSEQ